jgi:prepilin signal peptidase PulO-like enzyme (type II secretory pathway)
VDILSWYLPLCAAFFGAIVGSFINALSFRYGTGAGMGGRSRCMHCGHTLSAFDLVPIISFLALRGRCRYCSSRISLQYPAIEALATLLSLSLWVRFPSPLPYALSLVPWMGLLFILAYDLRHKIVPMGGLLFVVLAALLFSFHACVSACHIALPPTEMFLGLTSALPLLLISAVSRGRWMGWGDGLLQLPLGLMLGLSLSWSGLFLAFWSGAIVGLLLVAYAGAKRRGGVTMKSEIPFAPFLVLGAAAAYFFHVDIFSLFIF